LRWLPLLLLTSCCAGVDWPVTLHLDEQWTENEITQITLALDEWRTATGAADYRLVRGWPHGLTREAGVIHRTRESDPGAAAYRAEHPNYAGLTIHEGSIIIAIDRVTDLRHLMLHELGHLYGFCGHEPNTLMHGDTSMDLDCIDSFVLEEVCSSHDCVNPRSTCK